MENNQPSKLDVPIEVYANDMNIPNQDDITMDNWFIDEINTEPVKRSKQATNDEKTLIGALFFESQHSFFSVGEMLLNIQSNWFKQPEYRAAFETMQLISRTQQPITTSAFTLYSQMKKAFERKVNDEMSLDDVIVSEMAQASKDWQKRTKNVSETEKERYLLSLIETVQNRYKQDALAGFSKTLPKLLKTDVTDKEKFRQIKLAVGVMDETFNFSKDRFKSLSNVAEAILSRAVEFADSDDKNRILGISSGYKEIDEQISGFVGGRYYIIAARPSMGKTTLMLNVMYNMAKAGKKVALFSYEMTKEQIVQKLLGMMTNINPRRLSLGDLTAKEWIEFEKATKAIGELNIEIYDVQELGSNDVDLMVDRCQELHRAGKLDAVFADYIQLMSASDRKGKIPNPTEMLSSVSNTIQFQANSLNVPFIVVAQLNREVEGRTNKTPRLSDLKGSGSLEQDAYVIMFLHREDYYEQENEGAPSDLAKVIFAKNREGERFAEITLKTNLSVGLFSDLPPINMLKADN